MRIAALEARVSQNSSNSDRPPSSDPPYAKRTTGSATQGRPGAKPGHPGHRRVLLASTEVIEVKPEACPCGQGEFPDTTPSYTHQVIELPEIQMSVTHVVLHETRCPRCGRTLKAELPVEHRYGYGPRLTALLGELSSPQRAWHYALQGETNFHNELRYGESFYAPLDQDPQSIPYLKLHGSFNWHYCWRCEYYRIVHDEWFGVSGFHLPRRGRDPLWVASHGTLACDEDECIAKSGAQARQAVLKPLIIPPARLKEYSRAPVWRQWALFDLLLAQAKQIILVGTSMRDEDILLLNSLSFLRSKNPRLKRVVVIDPAKAMKRRARTLTEVETTWYPDLGAYIANG